MEGEGGKNKYKGGERERIGRGEGTETRNNASLENSQPPEHRWGRGEGWGNRRKNIYVMSTIWHKSTKM